MVKTMAFFAMVTWVKLLEKRPRKKELLPEARKFEAH